MSDPKRFGLPADAVELVERRHRHGTRFRLPDGRVLAVFSTDLHHEASPGQWEECDYDFRPDGGDEVSDRAHHKVRRKANRLEFVNENGKGVAIRLPGGSSRSGRKLRAEIGGVEWEWRRYRAGMKASATVSSRQGRVKVALDIDMIGGEELAVAANGSLRGSAATIPRPFVILADGEKLDIGPWDWKNGKATVEFDDSDFPDSAFPYIIDPSTFSISAGANDGVVTQYDSETPVADDNNTEDAIHYYWSYSGHTYKSNGFCKWDTSSLGDSDTISEAYVRMSVVTSNPGDRYAVADYYNWGASLTDADFSQPPGTTAWNFRMDSLPTTRGYYNFPLTNPNSNISKTGTTYIRMGADSYSSQGTDSKYTPAWYENTSYDEPQLVVTVSTNATATPSGVSATSSVGSVSAGVSVSRLVNGQETQSAFGSLGIEAGAATVPAGRSATSAYGTVSASALTLSGVDGEESVASVGDEVGFIISASKIPVGRFVTAAVGLVSISVTATVAPVGVEAASAFSPMANVSARATTSAITGQQATAGRGDVVALPETFAQPAGRSVTASRGTLTASGQASASLSGQEATAARGSFTVTGTALVIASGQQAAAGFGALSILTEQATSVSVEGVGATASAGTTGEAGTAEVLPAGLGASISYGEPGPGASHTATATGQEAATGYGTPATSAGATTSISGRSAASDVGSVAVSGGAAAPVGGRSASGEVGAPAVAGTATVAPAGVAVAGALGDANVALEAATVFPEGAGASAAVGTVAVVTGQVAELEGQEVSARLPGGGAFDPAFDPGVFDVVLGFPVTVTATAVVAPAGQEAAASVGSVGFEVGNTSGASGQEATSEVGAVVVILGENAFPVGQEALASLGMAEVSLGSIRFEVEGASVTASTGSVVVNSYWGVADDSRTLIVRLEERTFTVPVDVRAYRVEEDRMSDAEEETP